MHDFRVTRAQQAAAEDGAKPQRGSALQPKVDASATLGKV
jgi:hypothetical protein